MTTNELAILLRAQMLAGLARYGLGAVLVIAQQQPTAQGRASAPAVYFFDTDDRRYGWQHRTHTYDALAGQVDTTEHQWHETRFQFTALAPSDPANLAPPTARDVLEVAAMVCNSQTFMQALRAQGVGVQRVVGVRTNYFENDRQQFEASPSFDLTVSWRRDLAEVQPAVERVEFDMGAI